MDGFAAPAAHAGGRCSRAEPIECCGRDGAEDVSSQESTCCSRPGSAGSSGVPSEEGEGDERAEGEEASGDSGHGGGGKRPPPGQAPRLPAPPQPGALEGVKSRRRPVLSLQLRKPGAADPSPAEEGAAPAAQGAQPEVALVGRVSLAGLSEEEARDLLSCLASDGQRGSQEGGCAGGKLGGAWRVWRHDGLRIAVVSGSQEASVEIAAAVAAAHIICVYLPGLKAARGGDCAVLRSFKGGLLLVEGPEGGSDEDAAGLLHALGATARWSRAPDAPAGLVPAPLPAALAGEMIGDLRLKDLEKDEALAALVAGVQPLYEEHFHEELVEELRWWEGSMLGLYVAAPPRTGRRKEARPRDRGALELLGLVVYKFWGPPLRAMSVVRVLVPHRYRMQGFGRQIMRWALDKARQKPRSECFKVSLCAMPEAIPFYERLNFAPIPEEEQEQELPSVEEGEAEGSRRMPGAIRMEYRCGRSYKPGGRR